MMLKSSVEKSVRWMIKCASLVDGTSVATTNRARVSISLHHLCIEHHTGIHTLVEHDVFGSAFALYRPQFEAYVRGAWFHYCATERNIEFFLKGNDPPKIGTLIQELETNLAFESGILGRMKKQGWSNLNDFTHGGATQVKARNTPDEIVQNFKLEHVASLVTESAKLSLLASIGIAAVCENDALAVNLLDGYRSIYETTL